MQSIAKIGRYSYVPWAPMQIMPIGDIQYTTPSGAADLPRLRRHLAWGMAHDVWFIGMGDFVDFLSPSNRVGYDRAGMYDTATEVVDRASTQLEDEIAEVLLPTKGRWIGLLQGHHYFVHLDGTTSDTRFAKILDGPYLGDCALIRVTFRGKTEGSATIKLWAHHGHGGGGVLPTAGLNKLYHQKVRYPGVRLFLMGHVPQLGHIVTDGLDVPDRGDPHVIHADTHYVLTGGFARHYQEGSEFAGRAQGGYAEKKMLPPAVLGGALIRLTPETVKHGKTSYKTVDVKVTS